MAVQMRDHIDGQSVQRGLEYARNGYVESVEPALDGTLSGRVSNGYGKHYRQRIMLTPDLIDGTCTCPVGHNCKHVAAALVVWSEKDSARHGLPAPVQGWLQRVQAAAKPPAEERPSRPEAYPSKVKDRLLYVLTPFGPEAKIDIFKGRINAAGTALNKNIRRYDALNALRSLEPAKFIRPVDVELLSALAQTRLWDASYGYGLPGPLRPKGDEAVELLRRVGETGRLLYDSTPDAVLNWSDDAPEARLAWTMRMDGNQQLVFQDPEGRPLDLRALDGATIWVDIARGHIGRLAQVIDETTLRVVQNSPDVAPADVEAIGAALPDSLGGVELPRPKVMRHTSRSANTRFARLTMGAETAHDGPRYFGAAVRLPVLTLRFVYDGQEVWEGDEDPRLVDGDAIVTLKRDHRWEAACTTRLMQAGALPIEDLEVHWPGDRMLGWDFAFADNEMNLHTLEISRMREALDFAFRDVPKLRDEGWDIVETSKWPFRLSDEEASLTVATGSESGGAFQGIDWFSLGFQAEVGGKSLDVAPLVAAFLDQFRDDWEEVPDVDALRDLLAERPVYLDGGKTGYVALDLSPLAALLHLFLTHHAELGALHPSEAQIARLTEDALAGSTVRFEDNAGILPLARSLEALSNVDRFEPPAGLTATLRDYQAYGAAWMGSLLEAGFGAVLADDMGLGKTLQILTLLQARRESDAPGPALLIVPTSLLHGWQTQAAQFTPELRLVVLHGPGRHTGREAALSADLVVTTYPLLSRDRDWLAAQDWPLVILDEAQTLKNPASQTAKALREIPAKGRLALTGTPLENSLQDIWTLVDWVVPGLLGDRKSFQALFRTPIEKHGDTGAQARLNRRLRPFLLRRTKEEVAAELPAKTEIVERVDLPRAQQALYETVRAAMDARVREAIGTRGLAAARITVLDALLKLRQVCCDPALVKTDAARSVTDSAKRTRLREQLTELVAEGRRVLVFSQFVEMLRLIEGDLAAAGIASLSLTGETRDRAGVLDAFARGDAPVFLLSLKAGGVGLTLTQADTVILYDPWWNPAVERQAMDRTHRIGQTKPVFVHRLVATGTVEEKILDMQARKQALANALFDPEADQGAALLDEATLQDLFAPLAS